MNFNNSATPPTASPPKKSHTKTIITLIIVGFIAVFGAIGLIQYIQRTIELGDAVFNSPSIIISWV
jgi:hypothetical protein